MSAAVSPVEFREALARFASGVTIVTAKGEAGRVGFTATGFSSVSLTPPLVLVCIGKTASAYAGVVGATHFGISILDESQAWVAAQFARKNVDRFEGVPIVAGSAAEALLVEGALVHMECATHARHEAGDHMILIGEVLAASVGGGRPLVHYARSFGAFVPEAPGPAGPIG